MKGQDGPVKSKLKVKKVNLHKLQLIPTIFAALLFGFIQLWSQKSFQRIGVLLCPSLPGEIPV